jgi:hypothetical protein
MHCGHIILCLCVCTVDKSTALPVELNDDNEDPNAVKRTQGERLTRDALFVATGIRLDDDAASRLIDALDPYERQQLMSLSLRAQLRDVLAGDPVFAPPSPAAHPPSSPSKAATAPRLVSGTYLNDSCVCVCVGGRGEGDVLMGS